MYVLDSCRDFIRTIPLMCHDEHNPEDLDSKLEDHAADEWRYLCMSMPITPMEPQEEYRPRYGVDPLDQFKQKRRR